MRIVTDCAADMPPAELQALDITQAPLYIQFPEGEANSADITADAFYDRLYAMRPAIPGTAQPSSGTFAEIYRRISEFDSNILSIHISSGLSGTVDAARLGCQQVGAGASIAVHDTLTLSGGERFQVLAAAWGAKAGWALDAIKRRLDEIQGQTQVLFTLETIEYLARGGRIGRVQAIAGSLLSIKPIIGVDHHDGKYNNVGRSRNLPRAVHGIVEHLHAIYHETPVWATVMHGRLAEQAEALAHELNKTLNVAKIETLRVSPVLGVHTGPGVVGAAVAPMGLFEGLM